MRCGRGEEKAGLMEDYLSSDPRKVFVAPGKITQAEHLRWRAQLKSFAEFQV